MGAYLSAVDSVSLEITPYLVLRAFSNFHNCSRTFTRTAVVRSFHEEEKRYTKSDHF